MKKKTVKKGEGIRRAALASVIGILTISVLAIMAVPTVVGDIVLPTSFYGNVTVGGAPASINANVTGVIVGAAGSPGQGFIIVTVAGKYGGSGGFDPKLVIQTDSVNDIGKTIEFYVDGVKAEETATYDSGVHRLDLTVGGVATGTVAGKITYDCNGTGIANVMVNLTQGGTVVDSKMTDGNGNYTFTTVAPGDYSVNASKATFWGNSTPVTVTAGTTSEANMTLWLKGDLDGDCTVGDADDLLLMRQACLRLIAGDWKYDLNGNSINGDIGDFVLLKRASLGELVLV